jgi:ATP-dependent DNA helicase RecG
MEYKLETIKGVGPSILRILRSQGIWSTYDLILRVPKSYEEFSIVSLDRAHHQEVVTITGVIETEPKLIRSTKADRVVFGIKLNDEIIEVIVFGRGYYIKTLSVGMEVVIKGTYHLYQRKIIAKSILKRDSSVPIKPVYGIEGIHDKTLSNIISDIFLEQKVDIYETIPSYLLEQYRLMGRLSAFKMLHLPNDMKDIHQAERRFKYEEAFFMQLKMIAHQPSQFKRPPKAYQIEKVRALIDSLPYELTLDQKNATNDIFRDFKSDHASYRLIQGDVGSGKTMVSLIASYAVITAGEQVAFMAPTELLAIQHYQVFKEHLKDVKIALLTGQTKHKEHLKQQIQNHDYDLIIGTHALLESDVLFDRLGLVVIDEQHKFGVTSREELIIKSKSKDVLYLTATPIPRTLAMVIFGNTHVSIIRMKPKERKKVDTLYIQKSEIKDFYEAIRETIKRKEHVFLIAPAITSTHVSDNIESVYSDILESVNAPIFTLHGRMSDEEKARMMESFIYTPGSILISTTMVEVGIDIPTATLMGIYAAENFGLSQLHQLRGRIGRSHLHSTCYLISEKEDIERLELLSAIDDGFKLAEYDLIERGPGDFLGDEQSGYLKFQFLDILRDEIILTEAQKNVNDLLKRPDFKTNPSFKYLNRTITDKVNV